MLRSDWTIYRGGAVLIEDTDNCVIENCYLHNLGGNAVFFSNYNRNSEVRSSHITNIGASAILFVGNPEAVRSPLFEYYESQPLENIDLQSGPKIVIIRLIALYMIILYMVLDCLKNK